MTNPVFNETPFITTELKPIFIYHDIPNDFITNGGDIIVGAVQARVAITERLGFIATLDGFTNIDFEDTLPDDEGFNDLAAGIKYAFVHDPAAGVVATAGLRYTAPVGGLESAGIDLNGEGGYLNPFLTGAFITGPWQVQGSAGVQVGLDEGNWSFVHASGHVDYEVVDGVFPFAEVNLFAPVDGGDRLPDGSGLENLTGADIADIGAESPRTILTVGGGARLRLHDNVIAGAGIEGNVLGTRDDTVYGFRVTTDLTIHF